MNKRFIYPLIVALMASCTQQAYVDKDASVDFGRFQTYQIHSPPDEKLAEYGMHHPERKVLIESIMHEELAKTGLRASDNPDLNIVYFVKLEDKEQVNTTSVGFGGYTGGMYGGMSYNVGTSIPRVSTYRAGTLIIDMIDASNDHLVWRGVGEETFRPGRDDIEFKVKNVVNKIIKKYP